MSYKTDPFKRLFLKFLFQIRKKETKVSKLKQTNTQTEKHQASKQASKQASDE